MSINELKRILESHLIPKRYIHSLNVMSIAIRLAERYGADAEKAAVAGLLHDYARDFGSYDMIPLCESYNIELDDITYRQPELLHGPLAAALIRERFGINDASVLQAVYFHTTGRENMSLLEKIVFISDYIEPGRIFPGVDDIRRLVFNDLDTAVVMALESTVKYVMKKGALVHPDSIKARNFIISQRRAASGGNNQDMNRDDRYYASQNRV